MRQRLSQIGCSQRLRLEWLAETAALVLAGQEKPVIQNTLQEMLRHAVSVGGQAKRGNREKVITILMKVWVAAPAPLMSLQQRGLEILQSLPPRDHLAIHWGMVSAVYPFWSAVAAQVGRLLRLQGRVSAAQIQRRLREHYGERETVARAARRVLRSFVDWGVVAPTDLKGIYQAGQSFPVDDPGVIAWLLEAALQSRANGAAPLRDLLQSPSLFPLVLKPLPRQYLLAATNDLEILPLGLDEELVLLKKGDENALSR